MSRTFHVNLSVMFGGRCQVTLPTKEEMAAGENPEVGLYANSFTLLNGKPTLVMLEETQLSAEDERLAAQLVYNTLAVHAATMVAEATQKMLDDRGKVALTSDSFPQGGAKA